MENWESADVSIPRIRMVVGLHRSVLLFEGRVNSPLRQTVLLQFTIPLLHTRKPNGALSPEV
jgi:hypothetical protein